MKLAIVGSRDFNDYELVARIIGTHFYYMVNCIEMNDDEIISGGARGADTLGKNYAKNCGLKYTEFLPNWNELGKKAGFVRNQQIVDACDMVLAFWDGQSKGTKHTIDLARIAKKPTFIVYF